ncbi:MAG: aldose 1-epimerase family protein [Streptococcaceae bacterium]|jgi:galactose mutarotase-like enzyme|nr:aldose 1-epimerase family protein [Streptococcaceae bacterium]
MKTTLQNDQLKVEIDSLGAEMHSIQKDGLEYLWQADPDIWARHAPHLFPIVGKLKGNKFSYQGQEYGMGGHGFARDIGFKLIPNDPDEEIQGQQLIYELTDNAVTKKIYPFAFKFRVYYQLEENRITVGYLVTNPDSKNPLYFSVGAHPAFQVPLETGEFTDYKLTFDNPIHRMAFPLSPETGLVDFHAGKEVIVTDLPLNHELFDHDALIYNTHPGDSITLTNSKDKHSVKVSWDGMPYVGLWSPYPKEGPFVCIEPWAGIADDRFTEGDFTQKIGIIQLAPGVNFYASYTIEIN